VFPAIRKKFLALVNLVTVRSCGRIKRKPFTEQDFQLYSNIGYDSRPRVIAGTHDESVVANAATGAAVARPVKAGDVVPTETKANDGKGNAGDGGDVQWSKWMKLKEASKKTGYPVRKMRSMIKERPEWCEKDGHSYRFDTSQDRFDRLK